MDEQTGSVSFRGRAASTARCVPSLSLLAACVSAPSPHPVDARVVWASIEHTLVSIAALEHGASVRAPWAVRVEIPEDLPYADFERVHEALRSRGYEAPHAEPSVLDVFAGASVRLALADPVSQPDVVVTAEVARRLWAHAIPFGIEGGNSRSLLLPRRAVPEAMRVLASDVPAGTRWRK